MLLSLVSARAEVLNSSPPTHGIYQISSVCDGKVHAFHVDILMQQLIAQMWKMDDGL